MDTLFVPAKISAENGKKPLMIVLHGLGDSVDGYRWLPEELRLDWLNYLLVNAPDEYYGGYSWYDLFGNPVPGIERSRALLVDLLAEQEKAGFPTEQTVMFGFSQGALMSYEVGLTYPKRLAGLVCVSGYINDLENLLGRVSAVAKEQHFLTTHGVVDDVIPFARAKEQAMVLRDAGFDLSWNEFYKGHGIEGAAEINLIRDFVVSRCGFVAL